MQILASALPGFRDLRAPLTAGYLWLVLLWITIKPNLANRPTNEVAGAVWNLGNAAGPIWVGLALGIIAYLIGSVSQVFSPALNWALDNMWQIAYRFVIGKVKTDGSRPKRTRALPRVFVNYHRDPVDKFYFLAVHRLYEYGFQDESGNTPNYEEYASNRAKEARVGLLEETRLPATLLLGQEPQLFSEADRLKAESQFRLAIFPPLIAIVIFAAYNLSIWWLLALIPTLILLSQSHLRNLEYRYLMFGAVERGMVKSESLDDMKKWTDSLVSDQTPRTYIS